MGVDYFARGVFGVEPEGPFYERFLELFETARDIRADADEEDMEEEDEAAYQSVDDVFKTNPDLLEELREQYHAPPGATMHWTGPDDVRPGRCATESDTFIFGVGMYEVLHHVPMKEVFVKQAQFHTWVEAY